MKSILITNLVADMRFQGFYLCIEKKNQKKRDGSPYLNLLLQDKSGVIRARIWDKVHTFSKKFESGDPVAVKGSTYQFGENLMIRIENISKANESKYEKFGFKSSDSNSSFQKKSK